MFTKKCSFCKKDKAIELYHKASKYKDGRQSVCKECKKDYDKQIYTNKDNKKDKNREYKNQRNILLDNIKKKYGCLLCPEKEPICLDFHHLEDKTFLISLIARSHKLTTLNKEIEKCILLCANCHRKVHAGILQLPRGCERISITDFESVGRGALPRRGTK